VKENGTQEVIAPWQIADADMPSRVSTLNAFRPDFNGALIQFLIGLVQTTLAPEDEVEWAVGLENPPSSDEIKSSFSSVADAFNLGGQGYRFMQDSASADGKPQPIDTLLIGMPGENTIKNNTDFFFKRNSVEGLCPRCAAMALLTLQVNGPAGGVGHRTGLRGGGPLTCIIQGSNIWETVWLNILPQDLFYRGSSSSEKKDDMDIFPWMGPLRTSEGGKNGLKTSVMDVNALQMFWGMGRRIYLDLDGCVSGTCDICDNPSDTLLTTVRTKTYGIWYDETWRHILTPYYMPQDVSLPVHCNPGGITYKHWLGLVQSDTDNNRQVAGVVTRFQNVQGILQDKLPPKPRLWAFGYDLENVKARCWYESLMPLTTVNESIRDDYEHHVAQFVKTADYIQSMVHACVKDAMYKSESQPGKGLDKSVKKKGNVTIVKTRFWAETEPIFHSTLNSLENALENGQDVSGVKREWLNNVRLVCFSLFDFYSQSMYVADFKPKRIVTARKRLKMTISPGAPKIKSMLELTKPEGEERKEV